ncbi:MAG: hypothetical protein JWM91_2789 [Rhodospirillales bacterium]|nr:hypothetical protein [Rhodospirillales bacterium]
MTNQLQPDATIADSLPATGKEEFVRQIVGNMAKCQRLHGATRVRIGVTGAGSAPYHRVSYFDDERGVETAYGAFVGGTPFKNLTKVHDTDSWSTSFSTLPEIQTLLGELRNFKPVHPAGVPPISGKGLAKGRG